jgi:hypothetical protein
LRRRRHGRRIKEMKEKKGKDRRRDRERRKGK